MSIKKMSESTLTDTGRYSNMSVGEINWGTASGGTEVTNGGYKYHTFTTDGTLTVTKGGKFDCLVIAGGGGGGSNSNAGGGAGGVVAACKVFNSGSLSVDVGSGGIGGFGRDVFTSFSVSQGNMGYPSIIGEVYAVGGGGGGRTTAGGSGGGPNGQSINYTVNGGFATGAIDTETHLGFNGGASNPGGGAGEPGGTDGSLHGGDGTAAFSSDWAASTSTGVNDGTGTYYYAGGGGGSALTSGGPGGLGGGGNGGSSAGENDNFPPTAGVANSGGGGGAGFGGYENRIIGGASGGSGLVIVRYKV